MYWTVDIVKYDAGRVLQTREQDTFSHVPGNVFGKVVDLHRKLGSFAFFVFNVYREILYCME